MSLQHSRRHFLTTIGAIAGLVACHAGSEEPLASISNKEQTASISDTLPDKPMPERILGKTAVSLPIFGLGRCWTNTALSHRTRG